MFLHLIVFYSLWKKKSQHAIVLHKTILKKIKWYYICFTLIFLAYFPCALKWGHFKGTIKSSGLRRLMAPQPVYLHIESATRGSTAWQPITRSVSSPWTPGDCSPIKRPSCPFTVHVNIQCIGSLILNHFKAKTHQGALTRRDKRSVWLPSSSCL